MEEMQAHPQRMMLAEHPAKLGGDPLRQHGRHLGADPQELDVRNLPQTGEDPVQPLVAQRQRIAAGNEHVADAGRAANVVERLFQPGLAGGDRSVPHHARPRAIAAVARAEIGHQQQHPVRVAVDKARHGTIAVFAQRVVGLAQPRRNSDVVGMTVRRKRLIPVVAGDQAHVVGRNAHREHRLALRQGRSLVVRKHQHLFQLGQGPQPISGLPVPIVPIAVGHAGVESLAKGPGLEGAARGSARRSTGGEDIALGDGTWPSRPRESRYDARGKEIGRRTRRLFIIHAAVRTRLSINAGH